MGLMYHSLTVVLYALWSCRDQHQVQKSSIEGFFKVPQTAKQQNSVTTCYDPTAAGSSD